MDARTALDLVRGYHAKVVKPFEKLGEVLEIAATAAEQVDGIMQQLKALKDQLAAAEATTADQIKQFEQRVKDAEASSQARITQATARAVEAEKQASAAEAAHQ